MAGDIIHRKRRKLKSEINVVPYIDVMLVLLIIFMVTGSCQESIGDTATHDQQVADLAQAVEHFKLGRHLGAGNNSRHRLGRGAQCLAQRVQLGSQQRASSRNLGKLGHAVGRALGAVSGTERVHHKHVAQGGVLLGQLVGVFLLALVEAHVFEQHDVARFNVDAIEVVADQRHFPAQGLAQVIRYWLEAVFSRELAFSRTSQVRADHNRRAFFQRQLDGRQRSKDARIAGDYTVLDWDVEVFADQYALTLQIEVGHLQHGHGSQFLSF